MKFTGNQVILDPGSHPASVFAEALPDRRRDLAGMTNYDTVAKGERRILLRSDNIWELKSDIDFAGIMGNWWFGPNQIPRYASLM